MVADALGARTATEDISGILTGARCYERRNEAIRLVVPEYGEGYKCKIVLPGVVDGSRYSIFSIVVQAPAGQSKKVRLTPDAYLGIVAATNFKQRARKMIEYHYADLRQYAVAGTPNLLEYELGFFVKNGDGAADFKPIAHLYKISGVSVGGLSGSTAGDPTAAADHRHLSAGSISGRVLLYGPSRKDGPLLIRKKTTEFLQRI